MSDLLADWKYRWMRYWLYLAAGLLMLLMFIVAAWWVKLTVLFLVVLVLAGNRYLFGRWLP